MHLDIAPKAWCTRGDLKPYQNMDQIPALYGPIQDRLGRLAVEDAIAVAKKYSTNSGVTYLPLDVSTFTTTPTAPPITAADFFNTARLQHVKAYEDLFNICIPQTSCLKMGLQDKKDVKSAKHDR